MSEKTIWAHTLVKNEERWLWFAVSSVINFVDKILLWDTGSTDKTLDIIKELTKKYPEKINFCEYGEVSPETFAKARQEMLDETKSDWFILVDADEIWWKDSIRKVTDEIQKNGDKLESIVVPNILPVGDIFHRQEERAGKYKIASRTGHYNLRAIKRNIPGLRSEGVHGVWGYVDGDGEKIQNRDSAKVGFTDAPYMHMTHLPRAGVGKDVDVIKRKGKFIYEIGEVLPLDFYYPEALFEERPGFISSPWTTATTSFKCRAFFETPLRKIKRRVWQGRAGY
jgi:glycosyltransferase involved in cell wall biosynthesis